MEPESLLSLPDALTLSFNATVL